jgi:hypothetical protein
MGTNPSDATSAVMSTGRIRSSAPLPDRALGIVAVLFMMPCR